MSANNFSDVNFCRVEPPTIQTPLKGGHLCIKDTVVVFVVIIIIIIMFQMTACELTVTPEMGPSLKHFFPTKMSAIERGPL